VCLASLLTYSYTFAPIAVSLVLFHLQFPFARTAYVYTHMAVPKVRTDESCKCCALSAMPLHPSACYFLGLFHRVCDLPHGAADVPMGEDAIHISGCASVSCTPPPQPEGERPREYAYVNVRVGVCLHRYLYKRSKEGAWQKRWFETNGCFLTYYKNRKMNKLLAALSLPQVGNIAVVPPDGSAGLPTSS
jgi:hypothetical protein